MCMILYHINARFKFLKSKMCGYCVFGWLMFGHVCKYKMCMLVCILFDLQASHNLFFSRYKFQRIWSRYQTSTSGLKCFVSWLQITYKLRVSSHLITNWFNLENLKQAVKFIGVDSQSGGSTWVCFRYINRVFTIF